MSKAGRAGAGAASVIADAVRRKLLQFVGDVAQYDDMTLVVVRIGKQGEHQPLIEEHEDEHGKEDRKS